MIFSNPSRLGIVACPGAKHFAGKLVKHLQNIYKKGFERKVASLVKAYDKPRAEIVQSINFNADLSDSRLKPGGPVEEYREPNFKVPATFTRFQNGEFKTQILQSVRGMDIYIVQDVVNHYPLEFTGSAESVPLTVNDHILNLLVTVDAVVHAGAGNVSVVIPSYPYSRQHKKNGREGLTASHFGRILEAIGVCRIITLDIHSNEIEHSFSRLSLENLHASYQILKKLGSLINIKDTDLVVVSPDTGAVDRNKFFAGNLHKPLALLYKERDYSRVTQDANNTNITNTRLLGSVEGKTVFMADDMLGTGGTFIKAMRLLKKMGAKDIILAVSLPFFTGEAVKMFDDAYSEKLFYRLIGTNAVYHDENLYDREWYVSADVSNLFARTISRVHHRQSISKILDNRKIIQSMLKSD